MASDPFDHEAMKAEIIEEYGQEWWDKYGQASVEAADSFFGEPLPIREHPPGEEDRDRGGEEHKNYAARLDLQVRLGGARSRTQHHPVPWR